MKRSRDVLSLAPFRLLAFAGATLIVTSEGWNIRSTRRVLHPCFANARFVYLCNPMQQKTFPSSFIRLPSSVFLHPQDELCSQGYPYRVIAAQAGGSKEEL